MLKQSHECDTCATVTVSAYLRECNYLLNCRGQVLDPNRADEDESGGWKLLDVASRRAVLRGRVGTGPDAAEIGRASCRERV